MKKAIKRCTPPSPQKHITIALLTVIYRINIQYSFTWLLIKMRLSCAFLPVLFVPWGINETATTEIPAAIM